MFETNFIKLIISVFSMIALVTGTIIIFAPMVVTFADWIITISGSSFPLVLMIIGIIGMYISLRK